MLPHGSFVKGIDSAGFSGYQTIAVIGEADSDAAQKLVKTAVAHAHALFGLLSSDRFEFSAWKQHDNLGLHVSPDAVRNGFYSKLYQSQGRRSTFIRATHGARIILLCYGPSPRIEFYPLFCNRRSWRRLKCFSRIEYCVIRYYCSS